MADVRPAEICRGLLAALDATEGRRRGRKRDTTPDGIGLAIKRTLLEEAVRDDPDPDAFEGWLLERCLSAAESGRGYGTGGPRTPSGSVRAMASDVLAEWRLAQASEEFRNWLEQGARSDDTATSGPRAADDYLPADGRASIPSSSQTSPPRGAARSNSTRRPSGDQTG
jgi:hypothetical protein